MAATAATALKGTIHVTLEMGAGAQPESQSASA